MRNVVNQMSGANAWAMEQRHWRASAISIAVSTPRESHCLICKNVIKDQRKRRKKKLTAVENIYLGKLKMSTKI